MNHQEHNGWYNYETWVFNLWMDNEEGSYRYWREVTESEYEGAVDCKTFSKAERAKLDLADRLKVEHEESAPELTGVFSDLLNAAMSAVNWYEIAEHMIDEYVQDKPQVKEGPKTKKHSMRCLRMVVRKTVMLDGTSTKTT